MGTQRFLIGFLLIAGALSAHAFDRPFPPIAKRGTMTPAGYPAIQINGKTRMLTPGALIRNQANLIEQPNYIQGSNLPVLYTETTDGDIDRVWILTSEEAVRYPLKQTYRPD